MNTPKPINIKKLSPTELAAAIANGYKPQPLKPLSKKQIKSQLKNWK